MHQCVAIAAQMTRPRLTPTIYNRFDTSDFQFTALHVNTQASGHPDGLWSVVNESTRNKLASLDTPGHKADCYLAKF